MPCGGREILKIQVGIVAAGGKRGRQVAFKVTLGQAVMLEEKPLFIHVI